jgi:hypothetical protein
VKDGTFAILAMLSLSGRMETTKNASSLLMGNFCLRLGIPASKPNRDLESTKVVSGNNLTCLEFLLTLPSAIKEPPQTQQPAVNHFAKLPAELRVKIYRIVLEDYRYVQFHCVNCTAQKDVITKDNMQWALTNRTIFREAEFLRTTEVIPNLCVQLTSPYDLQWFILRYGPTHPNMTATLQFRALPYWDNKSILKLAGFRIALQEMIKPRIAFETKRWYLSEDKPATLQRISYDTWADEFDGEKAEVHVIWRNVNEIIITGHLARATWLLDVFSPQYSQYWR